MTLRRISWLFAVPALLAAAGLLGWWWLLHTESGARWVFEKAATATTASVGTAGISGDLGSGLRLDGFSYDDGETQVEAATLEIAIQIDLLPLAVELSSLTADEVTIRIVPGPDEKPGKETKSFTLEMPFPLTFRQVELSGIQYLGAPGSEPLFIDSIQAAGRLHESLVLDRLTLSLPSDRLELSGQVALAAPHALALKLQTRGRFTIDASLDGDTDLADFILDATEPQARIAGTVGKMLSAPAWSLEVDSPSIHFPLDSPDPVATLTGLQAQTSGEWPQFDLDLAAGLVTRDLEPVQLVLTGSGSESGFTAERMTLRGAQLSLDASGSVSWEDALRVNLAASLERLEPGKWLQDWPDNHPLGGDFAVQWSGQDLTVSDFSLVVANTAFSAQGHGTVALESGLVDANVGWNDFSWPPGSPTPVIASRSGKLAVSGQPDRWKLDGTVDLQSGDYPPGQLQLSGEGDDESLNVIVRQGNVLGGTISGNLSWNWTGSQPFKAEVSASQVDISPLLPDYPGVLDTRLSASGEVEPFSLGVELHQLDGTLRGYPLTGHGGIHIQQGRVFADDLHLASGASSLTLDGSLYQAEGIDFSADIDSLGRFSADFRGSLSGEGNVSLQPDSPRISVSLSGQDLVLGPIRIERLETRKPQEPGYEDGGELSLAGVVIGQRPAESITIRFGGEMPLQKIAVAALLESTEIGLELKGSVNDWRDPLASGWRGELSQFQIVHNGQPFLSLDQATALEWTPSLFTLEPACLSDTGAARLCLASAWRAPAELSISADLAAIPVSFLEMVTDTEFRFTQVLNGALNWSQTAELGRSGAARFEISPGAIQMADDDEILLQTGAGRFGFELSEGALQKGDLDFTIPGTGEIDIDFNVPDLSFGSESPLFGFIRVDFSDLAGLGPIFPLLDSMSGAFKVDLALSGILADPAFNGSASLSDGSISNHASGIALSEINLAGEISDTDRTQLMGSFRAGEGSGSIGSVIYFEDMLTPVVELTLKGESLTIIDVPDLNVVADPDLAVTWRDNMLEINGRLFIPRARLSPRVIPQASVRQSEDVVIVAGELPDAEEDALKKDPVKIRGSLEVELGKQAEVDLELAKVKVRGTTLFTWQDDLLPIANGNFDIRGDIQAYGQFLKVTRGRISFPDIPADNPHLNIRAERTIYGNTQIQKAGLMVAGTAKRPVIEAYTVPMTNKDRAQTLLVTGSDFNYEQGVGAVAVGAYVLPRLYISYGIGVFEEGSVISARYDLGNRFGVKVTSGQKDTGVDLNYTIEH